VDGQAATLIHLRVTRILKSETGIHVGDQMTILERIGHTNVFGVEVCIETPDYRLPQVGEEIIAGGDSDPVNLRHLQGYAEHRVFFVRNGSVERGAREPEDWKPISLDELAAFLKKGLSK
jgi:hypothetical protein